MINPSSLSIINILLFLSLGMGLIFYKFVYPKKNINFLILLLLISLLPVWSIFRPGDYESGDFNTHVYRSISFYTSLSQGQILPNWAKDLNATYGYETFIIGPPLIYYSISFFHFLGFSFITSLKLLLATSFVLSGSAMYLWIKKELGNLGGFIAGVFYLFAPYHLVDMHFRVSPGDMLVYLFLPLSLYACNNLFKKITSRFYFLLTISIALTMLSHPISLVALTFIFLYLLFSFFTKRLKRINLLFIFSSIFLGLMLSFFYWGPILLEKAYVLTSLYPEGIVFDKFTKYIYTQWRYGFLFQGPKGEITYLIGYIQIFLLLISFKLLHKNQFNKSEKQTLLFYLSCLLTVLFLFLPISIFVWNAIPFYNNFQFAYRLSFIVVLFTACISAITLKKINNKYIIAVICSLAILTTILNWGHRRVIPEMNDNTLINNLPYSTYQGEGGGPAVPVWINPKSEWMKVIPKTHIEIIYGNAKFSEASRTSILHRYVATVESNSYIKENTYYYPGWELLIDNKIKPITYNNQKFPGIITFHLEKGLHEIRLEFKDTFARLVAKIISIIFLFLFIISLFNIKRLIKYLTL